MEKENDLKNEAIIHKDNSLKRLDLSILKHIALEEYKQSHLLSYWINDFANYHDNEKTFDPSSLKAFKRGDIVKVNLGFNIGNELGGLHYCVVINKNDNPNFGTLNVIPLSSIKENKNYNSSTCVNLGNELYLLLSNKYKKKKQELDNDVQQLTILEEKERYEKTEEALKKLQFLRKIEDELSRMKSGSIAFVHQITTISKQRIFKSPVSGIRLSDNSLDLIDEKINKIFTK